MDYKTEFVSESTLPQVVDALKGFFGELYYGADLKYIQWQYFDSPFKKVIVKEEEYSILTLTDSTGNILAMDAFLPCYTFVDGKKHKTIWDIEWINFSKIRGLGRELLRILRKNVDVYCGFGMNQLSTKAFQRLGYKILPEIERKIAILDAKKCIELFEKNKIKDQDGFLHEFEVSSVFLNTKHKIIEDSGKLSGDYWLYHLERVRVTSFKGLSFLKWRYYDHPYIKYYVISLDTDGKNGIAVVRPERVKGTHEYVLRILELFPTKGYESALINAVLAFGKSHGAFLIDFFCASSSLADEICPPPFLSLTLHKKFEIPSLFQPIEIRERKSINMVMEYNSHCNPFSFEDIYATKGDGDQDVQVNEDYATISL